jgi:hypothetical protein
MADANCTPLSEVTVEGTPNRLTHLVKKVAAHSSVEVPQMGTASAHLVLLSTIVKRWEKPPVAAGSGPTRSTWNWLHLCVYSGCDLASRALLAASAEFGDVCSHSPPYKTAGN